MSNIPLFDSDSESSPRSTPRSFPSADENDDPMYDFYRPRRNAIPVLSRVNAIDGSNNSIRNASTISNDSVKPPTDPDSGSDSDRESFMFDSDMDGGKLRRSRRRRTHRRKTHRRHRRKTHRRHSRKTHRRRRSHRRH
jgi:hypothetical protein